ncbi:hypothetical protein [Mesorhizobium shangrilense]|uniref:BA14K family protein n=1 Tax=Mesorhizobium shangrilense TaxID=460060 RepID=A0ABV2DQB5_9HYPH
MKFLSCMAAALVSTFALTSAVSVDAAPMFLPKAQSVQPGVIQIRDGVRWRHHFRGSGNYERYRGYYRPGYGGYDDSFPSGIVAGALIGSMYYGGGYYGDDPYYEAQYRPYYYRYHHRHHHRYYYHHRYHHHRHYYHRHYYRY